jgi:chitodextrinase
MSVSTIALPLTEQFTDPEGRLQNYYTSDVNQLAALARQRHCDIRCFVQDYDVEPASMFFFDQYQMGAFEGLYMQYMNVPAIRYYEGWRGSVDGSVGPQPDLNNWYGLTLNFSGPTQEGYAASGIPVVDLSAFAPTDTLSLALPGLAPEIDRDASFIAFTSNPDKDFLVGPTVQVPFSGLPNGDVELAQPLSVLAPLGTPLKITGLAIVITTTAACVFRCLAIRVLTPTWVYAPLDLNTLTGSLVLPVSRTGSSGVATAFPANTINDPYVPTDWPILLRADTPSGADDPRPIDIAEAAVFHTGSMTDGEVRLYFREYAFDLVTQLDLDNGNNTQEVLNAIGHQIDFDTGLYRARDQTDLNTLAMSALDQSEQFDLEVEPDYVTAAWIEVNLTWDASTATLIIRDTEGNDHTFEHLPLLTDTTYVLLVDLRGTGIRVRIYPLDNRDKIDLTTRVFDSTRIDNGSVFSRRSGRVGWYARFADGDAYLDSLRYFDANFAEYRSVPLRSLTPVDGGQIFYGGSGSREGFTGVSEVGSATVAPDATKSGSGAAYRVDIDGTIPQSGVATNVVYIENFDAATVEFDLYIPSDAAPVGDQIFAYLADAYGQPHRLNLGRIEYDKMRPYRFDLNTFYGRLLPGNYSLHVVLLPLVRTTFYIDAISIRQRALIWSGRSDVSDPWGDNGTEWIPFRDALNGQTAGALFASTGTSPQIRAQACYQNSALTQVKFVPRSGPLGRLVWPEDHAGVQRPVLSGFAMATSDRTVTFSLPPNNVTLASGNWLSYYEWSFGDGTTVTGPIVEHTYGRAGTYRANLTVADNEGMFATVGATVIIS